MLTTLNFVVFECIIVLGLCTAYVAVWINLWWLVVINSHNCKRILLLRPQSVLFQHYFNENTLKSAKKQILSATRPKTSSNADFQPLGLVYYLYKSIKVVVWVHMRFQFSQNKGCPKKEGLPWKALFQVRDFFWQIKKPCLASIMMNIVEEGFNLYF
jgi:hypothetical protein